MRKRDDEANEAAMERMRARGFAPVTALELPHITCSRNLPQSFAPMVLKSKERQTAAQIQKTHQLPLALAEIYAESSEFFVWLRDFRDQLVHSGRSVKVIFEMENGYGIKNDMEPFSNMDMWNEANTAPNDIGSLHSAISFILTNTFATMDRFARYINGEVKGSEALAVGCNIFIRGHNIHELNHLVANLTETPWYDSPPAT